MKISRFDVLQVALSPTKGSEINKVRPVLVISPNELNYSKLKTVIVAPMTTTIKTNYPFRVDIKFNGKEGQVALDQLRAIDKMRIIKSLGSLEDINVQNQVLKTLQIMFAD